MSATPPAFGIPLSTLLYIERVRHDTREAIGGEEREKLGEESKII